MPLYTLSTNPKNIPGLKFWLDAADESTVTYFNKTVGDFASRPYGDTSGAQLINIPFATYPTLASALNPATGWVSLEMGVSSPLVLSHSYGYPGTVSYLMVESIRDKISNIPVVSTYSFTRGNPNKRGSGATPQLSFGGVGPLITDGTSSLSIIQPPSGNNQVGDYRTMSRPLPYEYDIPARRDPATYFGYARKYPRYEDGAVNGKRAIKFNKPFPGEIGMIANNLDLLNSATYTVFCVYAPVNPSTMSSLNSGGATAQGQYVVSIYDSNRISRHRGYPNLGFFYGDGSAFNHSFVVTTQSTTFSSRIVWSKRNTTVNDSDVVISQFRSTATSSTGIPFFKANTRFVYGYTGSGVNSGTGSFYNKINTSSSTFVIGYNPTTGTNSSQSDISTIGPRQFTGYFCEFLYYDRFLSDVEMLKVNQYLSKKWKGPVKSFPKSFSIKDFIFPTMQSTTNSRNATISPGCYQLEVFWRSGAFTQQGRISPPFDNSITEGGVIQAGTPMYCRLEVLPNFATGSVGNTNTWRHFGIWCGDTNGTTFGGNRWGGRKPDLVYKPGLTQGVYESTFTWPFSNSTNNMEIGWSNNLGASTFDYGWTWSGWFNIQMGNLESI